MIDRVALDALVLRAQFPELTLREGASVVARVAARHEAHGVIVLGGVPLTAELPPEVREGETLHLRVQEVTEERVTLRLEPRAAGRPAARPPPPPRPARVAVGRPAATAGRGGDEESATVALAFDSAVLGRLDLRVDLSRGGVQVGVEAPAGAGYAWPPRRPHACRTPSRGASPARPPSASPRAASRSTPMPEPPRRRATALRYEGSGAPKVVASGQGAVADRILAHAREAGVPVREDPALAAALSVDGARAGGPGGAVDGRRRGPGVGLRARAGGEYPKPVMWGRDPRVDITFTEAVRPPTRDQEPAPR